jgi:hypothetical protein
MDSLNAWAAGCKSDGYGTILRTWDGGETWYRQGNDATIPAVDLYGIGVVDGETAWACGQEGTILRTVDGGQLGRPVRAGVLTPEPLYVIAALDSRMPGSSGKTMGVRRDLQTTEGASTGRGRERPHGHGGRPHSTSAPRTA